MLNEKLDFEIVHHMWGGTMVMRGVLVCLSLVEIFYKLKTFIICFSSVMKMFDAFSRY